MNGKIYGFLIHVEVIIYLLLDNFHECTFTQITNTKILALIAVLVFKLLSRKVLFINRKDNRNC